jgi:hypothetical protein
MRVPKRHAVIVNDHGILWAVTDDWGAELRSTGSGFRLTKWYLDCVADSGDAAIVYCAELNWGAVHLQYRSMLRSSASEITNKNSIRRECLPAESSGVVTFESRHLGVKGTWTAAAAMVECTVFESDEGSVHWCCIQPKSRVKIDMHYEGKLDGLGYAERLTLTIPPWKLPMRELRWGRFISKDHSLVWIDWQGDHAARNVYLDGTSVGAERITDSELVLRDCSLQLDCERTLRSGRLLDTVLPGAPLLARIFPIALMQSEEHKWRSRGVLTSGDKRSEGWAIHEVVHWNR